MNKQIKKFYEIFYAKFNGKFRATIQEPPHQLKLDFQGPKPKARTETGSKQLKTTESNG